MSSLAGILVSLVASVVPTILYVLVIWRIDRYEKEPLKLLAAAFLWGALRNGAGLMQVRAQGISIDLVNIIQALVIMFIAADQIIRWLYRLRARREAAVVFTRGWGG